tara:strand:- start:885 stop:1703 length:819 start_codon:yes stop_codon:yes gene_type:complete
MRDLANRLLPRPVVRTGRRVWNTVRRGVGLGEPADPALADLSGDGDWKAAGNAIVLWTQALCGVSKQAHVLDIGCGPGRMAEGLLGYLDETGRYTGFDVSARAIDSAQSRLGADGRATFIHADIANLEYNPTGTLPGHAYAFPVPSDSIDFAFATSVFTHMHGRDVDHYLAETARVLKPGGCALFTAFLLDDESRVAMAAGRTSHRFNQRLDSHSASIDARTPERAIAFEDDWFFDRLEANGLTLDADVHRGTWRGHAHAMAFQDLMVVRKA